MNATATITVKVGAFPGGTLKEITLHLGATIKEFLAKAKISHENRDVRLSGIQVDDLNAKPKDGDQILVFGNVRGN